MVFEDMQWIDPTSRDLIDLIVDRVRRLPVMLLLTFRPEFQPPWADQPVVTTVVLNRLGERHGSALVERLAGNAGVSGELVAEIVERSDGVPLFIEELTKAVVETGADRGDLTVSGVLASALAVHPLHRRARHRPGMWRARRRKQARFLARVFRRDREAQNPEPCAAQLNCTV
jgi:hypothetical protein